MTGRRYYLTTVAAWQRHAPCCAETHFLALESRGAVSEVTVGSGFSRVGQEPPSNQAPADLVGGRSAKASASPNSGASNSSEFVGVGLKAGQSGDSRGAVTPHSAAVGSGAVVGSGFSPDREETPPTDSGADQKLVFMLITADEAAHIALENDADVEALPHPLARTPISARAAAALAPFGVVSGDDTFTASEKLALLNPLLRHRVF
jgi:hypothetical protein